MNLEHLAEVVTRDAAAGFVHPETQIGTDSHTTMINGLGVLGWGVGGIEAEAAMLGEPVSMLIPDVIGVRLNGEKRPGITATDIVLTVTERLRQFGVVERFVEFFGPGVRSLSVGDRATIANMAPEYGATCGLFPVDDETLRYLETTNRAPDTIRSVRDYAKASGLWDGEARDFANVVDIDLSTIGRSVAGPKRPHERAPIGEIPKSVSTSARSGELQDGDIVIAAITSCTNTSNAHGMIAAGLLARNAAARGMRIKPSVKTTLSPGSRAVVRYLADAGLLAPLEALGFHVVGYGCATCVGNSGPLNAGVEDTIKSGNLSVAAVLSGNRNFEGRIHPQVKLNYLASPALVVAYALAGSMRRDLDADPVGTGSAGEPVFLRDLWPGEAEIEACVRRFVTPRLYANDIYSGGLRWDALAAEPGKNFVWRGDSTYVGPSPFIAAGKSSNLVNAAPLLVLGDNVTTDHISPVGPIPGEGPAADFLHARGIARGDFNSYGARRGNADIMARGTFGNPRLRNALAHPTEGAFTLYDGKTMPIFEAAENYRRDGTPLVVVAGKNYGAGSARDWAAKGTLALGIRAVIAESFERIHRANLALMGVLPLQWKGANTGTIDAQSRFSIALPARLEPRQTVEIVVDHKARGRQVFKALARIDTAQEADYFAQGGVLPAVMNKLTVPMPHGEGR
jgi:aconitate hydratase